MIWLVPLIVLTLGLAATLGLVLCVQREVRIQTRRNRLRVDRMLARLEEAAAAAPPPVYVPVGSALGLNQSRRVQAIRLLTRGEGVEHVAAALGIPRAEVELLVRVQAVSNQKALVAKAS